MNTAGIILLVLGAVIFGVSFFIPDRGDKETKQDIEQKREQIRRLLETELDGMKLRVNEATNETVEFGMEKSERALEKITNDKIMAVNEYAEAVLGEIDRNHKEVMFLYDMLNDKQTDIRNTVRHAEAAVKEAEDAVKTVSDTAIYAANVADAVTEAVGAAGADGGAVNAQTAAWNESTVADAAPMRVSAPTESVFSMAAREEFTELAAPEVVVQPAVAPEQNKPEEQLTEFEILEQSTKFNNINNNNQMILKLNSQGVPVVDIARQLGLGVGEVQLVIDLFK